MNEFIDTNLLLRYLRGGPEDQFHRAQALIDSEVTLIVTEVALLEAAFVLRGQYGLSREQIVDVLLAFVQKENIRVHNLDRNVVIEALQLCRPSNRVNFGDAMIWAALRCAQPARLYSFDERFPGEGIEIRRP
jgi:predicted nucleic-acid-binding protein